MTLARNTRPEANSKNDRGPVSDSWDADQVLLVLQRSPEKEHDAFIDSLNDRNSPNFHHWLTAEEFGERYGVAQQDIDTITSWLRSNGFRINQVYTIRVMIDFSGPGGSIRQAFHTEIHQLGRERRDARQLIHRVRLEVVQRENPLDHRRQRGRDLRIAHVGEMAQAVIPPL